ncbi:MAG: putative D,D-dipeptide transport system permease protein DdpB [Anaerolineales bacterium]|nr:putative D,D-dipeptide transport system permease protein DdpB [Anaerolineales bacterium]
MQRFLVRRIILLIPLLIGVSLVAFVISHAVPSDPMNAALGPKAVSDPEIVATYRAKWGLDEPLYVQYLTYVGNLLQGDLGRSIINRRPVADELGRFLPATMELATAAIILTVLIGMPLGVISAVRRNTWVDRVSRVISLIGVSVPVFWFALLGLFVFYARLGWLPGPGRLGIGVEPPDRVTGFYTVDALLMGDFQLFRDSLGHLVLPAIVLAGYSTGLITRVTRSAMLEVLGQDYVRTARSKGLREYRVMLRHALPNALIPTVTVLGLSYGSLLAGTVLTEIIFSWPGIGQYAYRSSTALDFPAIMGVTMLIALIFILVNLVVDAMYVFLDPRLR